MTVEPFEIGHLVYLAAVPLSAGATPAHRLHFKLRIKNEGGNTETLQKITVGIFPNLGSAAGVQFHSFDRNIALGPFNKVATQIAWNEEIPVPDLPLVKYEIRLNFLGHAEQATTSGLARPHISPTPQKSYRFFGNTDDMGFHEYFVPGRHIDTAQFFEYDVQVWRWISAENKFRLTKPGSSGKKNEEYFGYGKPLYALADGTVINAIHNITENPAPGQRALMRVGENEAGLVSAFSLVRLSQTRLATAVRTAAGTLKVILWEMETPGVDVANSQLIRLGDSEAEEAISNVDAFDLTSTRLVTALRLVNGALKLIVWEFTGDGLTLTRLGEAEAEIISQLTAVKLTASRLAISVITATGKLKVIVWDVVHDGSTLVRRGEAEAGGISRLDSLALDNTRLLTAVRTATHTLKLIVWEILDDGTPVQRNAATVPGTISDLSVAWIRNIPSEVRVATAVRAAGNQLKILYWKINASNNLELFGELEDGNALAVKLSHVTAKGEDDTAACTITPDGTLQLTMWRFEPGSNSLWAIQGGWIPYSQNGGGPADLIDIIWLQDSTPYYFVTAVRTAQNTLKLIAWFLASGGGNYLLTLHGDEVVAMDHMMNGSLNPALLEPGAPVKQGQFVGRLGNSGASGAPHLHIEAAQIDPGKSVEELIADKQNEQLSLVYRPIPFHNAQALRLEDLKPALSVMNNQPFAKVDAFAKVEGNGFYWEAMGIWPGTTTPGLPTGRPGLTFWGVNGNQLQALFEAVIGANYHMVWIDGYAQGNTLSFNVLFRPNPTPAWSAQFGLTGQQYDQLVQKRKEEGFRPVHVNSYHLGDQVRYAAIFRKADGIDWKAYHGRLVQEHQALFEEFRDDGFSPVNVSVISIDGERRYTALYEKRNVGTFLLSSFLTTEAYQEEFINQDKAGRLVTYLDAYLHNGGVRYSAIWNEEHKGISIKARHHLTATQLQEEFDEASGDGFVTTVLAGYFVSGQTHFAAVWRKSP
jgi:hypothetical protein